MKKKVLTLTISKKWIMKELSIEEKAKAYDEAIERAESIYNETAIPSATTKGICTYIFPELKESEDEMMIQYFKDLATFDKADELYEKYGFSHKDAIAWLEKQGEQKLLYVNDNAKEMFIKALERVEEQNKKGYKLTDCDKNSWWEDFKAYTSCIIEQKPAWSEEDEEIYRKFICAMRASACGFPEEEKFVEQVDNWFKSLKDRYTWKPSEEQMNTLEYYMHTLICNEHKEVLFGLYADLKKLKEE